LSIVFGDNRTKKVLDYFDSIADSWYGHTLSMKEKDFSNRTIKPVLRCIEKIGKLKEGQPFYFLDAGSGSGYWSYEIMIRALLDGYLEPFDSVEVWLIDLSSKMLESAKHVLKYNTRYKNLVKLRDNKKLRFEYVNIDVRKLDEIDPPKFDFTFFHKALSMLEYGQDVQKTFSNFSKSTDFLLTAVKSKKHYTQKINMYYNELSGVDHDSKYNNCKIKGKSEYNEKENILRVEIETGGTIIKAERVGWRRWKINDDARPRGKDFYEYTYDSSDLRYFYNINNFDIIPSYNGNGVELEVVGKPRTEPLLYLHDPVAVQDYFPIIQIVGRNRSS
jgi:ubiquinone/menaquinone biosynthesis C-methylase UbiE